MSLESWSEYIGSKKAVPKVEIPKPADEDYDVDVIGKVIDGFQIEPNVDSESEAKH